MVDWKAALKAASLVNHLADLKDDQLADCLGQPLGWNLAEQKAPWKVVLKERHLVDYLARLKAEQLDSLMAD
jgi:hypothetical protein